MPFVGHASEYEDCGTYSQDVEDTRRAIEEDMIQVAGQPIQLLDEHALGSIAVQRSHQFLESWPILQVVRARHRVPETSVRCERCSQQPIC
jgi:hypothetical protein